MVLKALGHVGMLRPERLLLDRQGALVERLGLGIAALGGIQERQVVKRAGDVWVRGPKRRLVDRQGALVERLGLGIAALGGIQFGSVTHSWRPGVARKRMRLRCFRRLAEIHRCLWQRQAAPGHD